MMVLGLGFRKVIAALRKAAEENRRMKLLHGRLPISEVLNIKANYCSGDYVKEIYSSLLLLIELKLVLKLS